jgi:hypothetical protein
MTEPVRVLTWNLERVPRSRRSAVEESLRSRDYDIAVLTETRLGFVHDDHVLAPDGPLPGRFAADERKVAIWSRWGWTASEPAPPDALPERWVAGTTETPGGPLRVIGVCIPYRFQWVRRQPPGTEKRRVYEEHLRFLQAIAPALVPGRIPQIVAGDFNQRVPPVARLDPLNVVYAREEAMTGHTVLTEDLVGSDHHLLLCHVASTAPAIAPAIVIDRHDADGHALSDHHGAVVTIDSTRITQLRPAVPANPGLPVMRGSSRHR